MIGDTPMRRETCRRLAATGIRVLDIETIVLTAETSAHSYLPLLEAGADPSIKDEDGKTPVEMAGFDECISHLFGGGKIGERPIACAPVKRLTVSIDAGYLRKPTDGSQ